MKTFREDPLPRSGKRDDPSVSQPAQPTRPMGATRPHRYAKRCGQGADSGVWEPAALKDGLHARHTLKDSGQAVLRVPAAAGIARAIKGVLGATPPAFFLQALPRARAARRAKSPESAP